MPPPSAMSRRTLLQVAGAGAAAAATGVTPVRAAARRVRDPLTHADRVFLTDGLHHGSWNRSGPSDGWDPTPQRYIDSGFTAPTFYNPPGFASDLMAGLPGYRWSSAQDPVDGGALNEPPPAGTPILTGDRAANADRLFSICVGDENTYTAEHLSWWTEYFARLRVEAPNAILHNNQWGGQWTDAQLRTYIQTCHPDLLTFDTYYFWGNPQFAGGSVTPLYNHTARYRSLALEGQDGAGRAPLAFGQYTCGFRLPLTSSSPGYERKYITSESQLKVVSGVTWAMGGRWQTLFRWELDATAPGWPESDGLFLNYADTTPTPQFYQFQKLNAEMRAFSPYLVRLRTKAIAVRRGKTATGATNPASAVGDFTAATDTGSWVSDITSVNTGIANNHQPGDVFFGSFRTVPGLTSAEIGSYLPGPHTRAFMLVNALTASNTDGTSHTGTGGRGVDCSQRITVTLNTSNAGNHVLKRVNRLDGTLVTVPLTQVRSGVHTFDIDVLGGDAHLFIWS